MFAQHQISHLHLAPSSSAAPIFAPLDLIKLMPSTTSSYQHPPSLDLSIHKPLMSARSPTSSSQVNKSVPQDVFFRAGYGNLMWTIFAWAARFVTGGIATPFIDTYYYTRFVESIRFRGRELVLKASLADFVILAIFNYIMTAITFGGWLIFADRVTARFVDSKLDWKQDDSRHSAQYNVTNLESGLITNPQESISNMFHPDIIFFSARPLIFWDWLFYIGTVLSLGFAYPKLMCWYYNKWVNSARINGERIQFNGEPQEFFNRFIVDLVLSICTCGLWKLCCAGGRMSKYLDSRISWA